MMMACLVKMSEQWILESHGRVQKNLTVTEGRRILTRKVSVGKAQLLSMKLLMSFYYVSSWKDR